MSWKELRLCHAPRLPGCSSRCNWFWTTRITCSVLTFQHLLDTSCSLVWCCVKQVPVKMEDKLRIKGILARKMLALLFSCSSLLFAHLFVSNVLFTGTSGILSTFKSKLSLFSKLLRSSHDDCRVNIQVWHPWILDSGKQSGWIWNFEIKQNVSCLVDYYNTHCCQS